MTPRERPNAAPAATAEPMLERLCADLRLLWTQAGGPSLRVLGDRVGLGKSQVGDILNGNIRRLPDWDVLRGLVESFRQYAHAHGRQAQLSLSTGIEEYWRPRHAVLAHALSEAGPARGRAGRPGSPARTAPAGPPRGGRAGADGGPAPAGVPRQLPLAVRHLAGRTAELAALTRLVRRAADPADPPLVVLVCGTAGVGKTTLAVYWAHQTADRFPDGQLYLNLRGFDPSGSPMTPGQAVRDLLEAFAVRPDRVPAGEQAQVDLLRSLLTGRRMLLVLDNAAAADQVRPLLPGSSASVVVVTSRSQLTGLVAVEGAHALTLDLLTPEESRDLLAARLGADRVAAEPRAVDDIVAACAQLPLTLSIVAARAAIHPGFPLAALADELRVARGGLEAFTGEDPGVDPRAVFSWSCRGLSPRGATLFRLISVHSGPDLSVRAAASLAGMPVPEVRPLLAELARAHLVEERAPGRFAFHDLLRAYAGELAEAVDPAAERRAAVHRVLHHYLHTAHAAAMLLSPHRDPVDVPAAPPGVAPEPLDTVEAALGWLATEHAVLLAAQRLAAGAGFDREAWQLAWTLTDFFLRRGHWQDWADSQSLALASATRLGDRAGQAHAHRNLGRAYTWLGRDVAAHRHLQAALYLFAALGDGTGEARLHLDLVLLWDRRGRHREALQDAGRALELYQAAGDPAGRARALNAVGWCRARLGRYEQALTACEQALALQRQLDDAAGQAATLDSIGYCQQQLGRHDAAMAGYRQALDLFERTGDRYGKAETLTHLGAAYRSAGDLAGAGRAWRQALEILDQLEHPGADEVRRDLAWLEPAGDA